MSERIRLVELLRVALEKSGRDQGELEELITDAEPADIAFSFEEFDPDETIRLLNRMKPDEAASTLVEMGEEYQREMIARTSVVRLQQMVDSLPPDDAADIYLQLPQSHRLGILASIDTDLARQIRKLSAYAHETAGSIMTTEFLAVREADDMARVLDDARRGDRVETDRVYVIDAGGKLSGLLSLQGVLQEDDSERRVADVMEDNVLSVHEDDDQEEVVKLATTYGLTTVPVVDDLRRLVGIVTADDLDIVAEEEVSEDIFRMAGTMARHPTKLPVHRRILNRFPAMAATVVIGLTTAQILASMSGHDPVAEPSLRVSAIRYVLIVIALAANVGNLANVVVVRGLATDELEHGRLLQPFIGEVLVGLGIGVVCAGLTFAGIALLEPVHWLVLGSVVSLALLVASTFAASCGFLLPLLCERVGVDPALAGPLVIALSDLVGTSLYVVTCLALL